MNDDYFVETLPNGDEVHWTYYEGLKEVVVSHRSVDGGEKLYQSSDGYWCRYYYDANGDLEAYKESDSNEKVFVNEEDRTVNINLITRRL